jgi:KilA-N domain
LAFALLPSPVRIIFPTSAMSKPKKTVIEVQGTTIAVLSYKDEDFISLTDMLKAKDGEFFISDWLRNRNTVEFLGVWESVFNPRFNYGEFAIIKSQAGLNSYKISVKEWVEKTNAIGLKATAGRYGGTFAHRDIAFEFGMWISAEFKIYLIKEFQRLKDDESRRLSLAWNLNRTLSKLNYRIHTDAVKAHLIPPEVTPAQAAITYATEADLLNVALFGETARQWRDANPKLDGNVRDYASVEQLLVLANMEGMNAEFIHMELPQGERIKRLNQIAIRQMQVLTSASLKALPGVKGK